MIELDVWIRFWGRIEIRWMSGNLKLAYENYVSRANIDVGGVEKLV
jgi:hypothetical protein